MSDHIQCARRYSRYTIMVLYSVDGINRLLSLDSHYSYADHKRSVLTILGSGSIPAGTRGWNGRSMRRMIMVPRCDRATRFASVLAVTNKGISGPDAV